eukprot:jgi/Ulvmu1/8931/UM005_0022.1
MPRVAKKNAASKAQASAGVPAEPWTDTAAGGQPVEPAAEPRTPTQSPTRPHIGYFGRSSCPCWRCVRNMGPLQRRKEVVEQDIADILLDAWHSSAPEGADVNLSHHSACAKALIDAADQQEINDLEAAFVRVEAEYDEQTLGDVADRILIYAVQKGWGAACKLCVKFKADVNAQDDDNGGTPLMYAIHNAHDRIVETLISLKADMEHEEQQGYTPLMVACLSDNATACEVLLKSNAELDNTDSKGRTALSMACRYGSLECVKVLTSYGANVSHRDEDGMSVLEHAEQNDRRQVVGLIKRAQLANQMRQRRRQKNQHKENGMSAAEFEERNERAKEQMDELLQEIEQEAEGAEARRARQRARRTARRNERRVAKRRENGLEVIHETLVQHVRPQHRTPEAEREVSKSHAAETNCASNEPGTPEPEQRDRFGCTPHEAAELNAFRRVLLEGRVSPEEAVWQWCTGEDAPDIRPEQLRKMWEFMVDAASQCREAEQHATFLNVISVLAEVCQNHGIGVKQGRKVKLRLEKVGPLRQQLVERIRPPVDQQALETLLEEVRSVELLLDLQLLERARSVLKTLLAGGAAAEALCAPEPSQPKSEDGVKPESPAAADGSVSHDQPVHAAAASMQQRLTMTEATPPPPPPPPRTVQPFPAGDTGRGVAPAAAMAGPHVRMQGGHGSPAPPPPGLHMRPAARTAVLHPPHMPAAPAPPPPRGTPKPPMDTADRRSSMPAPPPAAPAPPPPPAPVNPFAGTSSHMADPMVDLLGSDLMGAMDSAGSGLPGDIGPRGPHAAWPTSSGPPMPGAPMQQRGGPVQPPAQVRMPQHGSPGIRPFGNNSTGMFRMNPPTNGAVSRPPPPGPPPPVPPPAPGMMDGYSGPKPPGMQRNGMKVHPSPAQHQQYGNSFASGMHAYDAKPEPPVHQPAHSGPFVSMGQAPQRSSGEVAGRYEQGLRFGQLSTRAPPFMPASKGSSNPQLPTAPMSRNMEMHPHMFQKAAGTHVGSIDSLHRSVGSLPSQGNDHKFARDLPSDPFGLDGPLAGSNDVHHRRHMRRDLTSDAVTSVLEGHAVRPKHDLTFSSGTSSSAYQGHAAVQSDEVLNWLGHDILNALDGASS